MTSAAPTFVALEADSMWAVIFAVSLVTLPVVLTLRRLIDRPGGVLSGLLLSLPLVLPLLVAVVMSQPVLPEIGFLEPADRVLAGGSGRGLGDLMLLGHGRSVALYTLDGVTGPLIAMFAAVASALMLLRRLAGAIAVQRVSRRCSPLGEAECPGIGKTMARLATAAGLERVPEVMLLPAGVEGAFAVGGRRGRVLVSRDLLNRLDEEEREATLAHEVAHLEACDSRVVFAAGLLRDLVAWNPIAHVSYRRLVLDRELEADRRAAAMTGSPLAVASSLLKMCELLSGRRRLGLAALVGFWPASGRIKRRVSCLIAFAEGRVEVDPSGSRAPFAAAALLALALAMQVGAQMTQATPSAVAFVWGAADESPVHMGPGSARPLTAGQGGSSRQAAAGPAADGTEFPPQARASGVVIVVRDRDGDGAAVIRAVQSVGPKSADYGQTNAPRYLTEQRQGWRAMPLLPSVQLGGVGVYRIEPQSMLIKPPMPA
ncbi:hypothetical protein BH18ACT15_BH18ACT15_12040 [soil metagenome]